MSKRSIIIPAFFLLATNLYGKSFVFEHSTCKVRFIGGDNKELNNIAKKKLKERKFIIQELINGKALLPDDLYYQMDIAKDDKLYKSCIITSRMLVAVDRIPRKADKILYKKQIKRSLPRVTFTGSERCRMAVKETFTHIPTCVKIGYQD